MLLFYPKLDRSRILFQSNFNLNCPPPHRSSEMKSWVNYGDFLWSHLFSRSSFLRSWICFIISCFSFKQYILGKSSIFKRGNLWRKYGFIITSPAGLETSCSCINLPVDPNIMKTIFNLANQVLVKPSLTGRQQIVWYDALILSTQ